MASRTRGSLHLPHHLTPVCAFTVISLIAVTRNRRRSLMRIRHDPSFHREHRTNSERQPATRATILKRPVHLVVDRAAQSVPDRPHRRQWDWWSLGVPQQLNQRGSRPPIIGRMSHRRRVEIEEADQDFADNARANRPEPVATAPNISFSLDVVPERRLAAPTHPRRADFVTRQRCFMRGDARRPRPTAVRRLVPARDRGRPGSGTLRHGTHPSMRREER